MELTQLPPELIHKCLLYLTVQECEQLMPILQSNLELTSILKQNIYGRSILYLNNKFCSLTGDTKLTKLLFNYIDVSQLMEITNTNDQIDAKMVADFFATYEDGGSDNNIAGNNNDNNDNNNDNDNDNNHNTFNIDENNAKNNDDDKPTDDKHIVIPERFVLSYSYNRSKCSDNEHDTYLKEFEMMLPYIGNKYLSKINNIEISIDLFNKKFHSDEVTSVATLLNSDYFNYNLGYLNLTRFRRLPEFQIDNLTQTLNNNLGKFSKLHTLTLSSNRISSIDDFKFPESLLFLNLDNNKLTSIKSSNLPPNLIKLNISCNYLTDLSDITFPEGLQFLDIQLNEIKKLNIKFPPNLKVLIACGNNIIFDDDEIVKFPDDLCYLNLLQNPYLNNLKTLDSNNGLKTIYIDAAYENKTNNHAITFI